MILVGVVLAPESPWWLVRKGRLEEAKKALLSLTSPNCGIPYNVDEHVAMIKSTDDLEKAMSEGTNYWDCFRGIDLRRTEITSLAWLSQAFAGGALMGYSVQFYRAAGMSEENALNLNLGQYAMGFAGTCGSWWLMSWFGRRTIYIWGHAALFIILLGVGGAGLAGADNVSASWAVGSLLLVYTFIYDFTIGPVCYSIVSEIPSTRYV